MVVNEIKTVVLLGLMTGVLLGVGMLVGGITGLTVALIFSILLNFGMWWFSDKIVLAMYKAKEATPKQQPELYKIVKEVAKLANMPMPKVYIVPSDSPNAFATGRSPKKAAVACTNGILKLLTKEELKGVIAHEMSHIKNRDTLIQVIAATIAGVIGYIAMMARFSMIFGNKDDDSGGLVELLVLAIITPIIATLLQLAISRSREYLADESAARILKDPKGLASALQKLKQEIPKNPMRLGNNSTSSIFIANPFSARGMMNMLSTHPPMDERIMLLNKMRF